MATGWISCLCPCSRSFDTHHCFQISLMTGQFTVAGGPLALSPFSTNVLPGHMDTTDVLLTSFVFPTPTHFCISFPRLTCSCSAATQIRAEQHFLLHLLPPQASRSPPARTHCKGALFPLHHTTPHLAQDRC